MSKAPLKPPLPPWLRWVDPDRIGFCARVRLARNVAGHAFPGWAEPEERAALGRMLEEKVGALPVFRGGTLYRMAEISLVERRWLQERHLISAELAARGEGSAVWVSADETVSVMINEEDHLRLQVLGPVGHWETLWAAADALDQALDQEIPYAFSDRLGFLTACPTNVGTGLRVSVLVHLPGLFLQQEMRPVVKALERLHYAVRGFLGEGSEMIGHMVQVSNQITLGRTEADMIRDFDGVVQEIIRQERWARERFPERGEELKVRDLAIRSAVTLASTLLLSFEEALFHLSLLQLSRFFGWFGLSPQGEPLESLYPLVLPGHLEREFGGAISPEQLDEVRALAIRQALAPLGFVKIEFPRR